MSLDPAILQKLRVWKKSPLTFVMECFQFKEGGGPSAQQIELLQAMAKDTKRITIRSGHGTGKDASASWVVIWFLVTRPYAKVVCTAPTARQLGDILWSEISKWLRRSILADEFVIQKDKIYHKEAPKEWWCRAISTSVKASKEEQAETLAGLHGDHLLIVVDEASGVPDPTFIPLEGALTQPDNKVLLIGNMTRDKGYFYDTHFHTEIKKDWHCLHWNSEKSTNVDPAFPLYMARKYGRDSDVYRIRVLGDPPTESGNTLIPLAWAQQCIDSGIVPGDDDLLYLSADIARYGEDSSIILPRLGPVIMPWEDHKGINTMDTAAHILRTYQEMDAAGCCVDEIGVGAGVVDRLEKHNMPNLYGINVANKSSDPDKWHRLRDELWLTVRDKCMRGLYNFPNIVREGDTLSMGEELANELSSVRYGFADNSSAYKVESKRQMKARGVVSPNIADALCLSEMFYNVSHRVFAPKGKSARKETRNPSIYPELYPDRNNNSKHSWMVV